MFEHPCFGHMLFWVSYMYVFCICTCSVQLSMFHMERCSRNTLFTIIIIIMKVTGTQSVQKPLKRLKHTLFLVRQNFCHIHHFIYTSYGPWSTSKLCLSFIHNIMASMFIYNVHVLSILYTRVNDPLYREPGFMFSSFPTLGNKRLRTIISLCGGKMMLCIYFSVSWQYWGLDNHNHWAQKSHNSFCCYLLLVYKD